MGRTTTRPGSEHLGKFHLIWRKVVFERIYSTFLITTENVGYGYSSEPPQRVGSKTAAKIYLWNIN